jgi:hypothetical protein
LRRRPRNPNQLRSLAPEIGLDSKDLPGQP